ncbi:MAG: outer membrane lipoprotein carrier protein LolA [Gemmatimonadota bacterium]|nr:outer membrane lipoprotein carrier protein LolA [Gemmatimonadota bacterium]
MSRRAVRGMVEALAVRVRGPLALGLAVLVTALGAVPLHAQSSDRGIEIIREAAERYRGVEALCADFTQDLVVPLLGDERTGTGRICQARPNRFAMRFTEPEGDRIVIDGEWVWIYYPSMDEKQVMRTPVSEQRGGHDFHREFLDDPETKYEVTYEGEDTVDGHPTHRLHLVPRRPAGYESAVLWIDRGTPALRRIRMEEENGTVRTVTLANIDFESDPAGEWFTFTPPEDAQIISSVTGPR